MELGTEISRGNKGIVYNCRYQNRDLACKIGEIDGKELTMIRYVNNNCPEIAPIYFKIDTDTIIMEKLSTTLYESIRTDNFNIDKLIELAKLVIKSGIHLDLHQLNIVDYKIVDFGNSYFSDREELLDQWSFFISMCTVKEYEPEVDENVIYRILNA